MPEKTNTEKPKRKQKKSETLEVRLDHQTKQDFIETCRENDTTASEVVRSSIDRYLKRHRRPSSTTDTRMSAMIVPFVKKKRVWAAGAGAVALASLAALPSAAGPDLKAAFERLDKDGDGVVTSQEFFGEQPGSEEVVDEVRRVIRRGGGDATTPKMVKEDAFALLLPPRDGNADGQWGLMMQVARTAVEDGADGTVFDPGDDPRLGVFTGMDPNGDGKVEFEEYAGRMTALLTRGCELLDDSGDGSLTTQEYARLRLGASLASPENGSRAAISDAELSDDALRAGFSSMDKSGDGRVSLKEYLITG